MRSLAHWGYDGAVWEDANAPRFRGDRARMATEESTTTNHSVRSVLPAVHRRPIVTHTHTRPRSSVDRVLASEARGTGSSPVGGTIPTQLHTLIKQRQKFRPLLEEYNGNRPHIALGGLAPLTRICQ